MLCDGGDLAAEPRQLQPYMYLSVNITAGPDLLQAGPLFSKNVGAPNI